MKKVFTFISVLLGLLASFCSSLDPARINSLFYKNGKYTNLDLSAETPERSVLDVLAWKILGPHDADVFEDEIDTPPSVIHIAGSDLTAPDGNIRITFIGHATSWISASRNGSTVSILTDPIFGDLPLVSRLTALPFSLEDLPKVDIVIVSHAHYDHCDKDTLLFLQSKNPEIVIILPDGMGLWASDAGLNYARTMKWFESAVMHDIEINFLPAHHWSNRGILDMLQYHWGSYMLNISGRRLYFAGDTGFSGHFEEIARRFPGKIDVALLPVGAYAPRWFMRSQHINPEEAALAASILRSELVLPVHWGTFRLTDEKLGEPLAFLRHSMLQMNKRAEYWNPGAHVDLPIDR